MPTSNMIQIRPTQLLDGAGYTEKDSEGFQAWPGTTDTISITIEGTALPGEADEDAIQQVVKYFGEVGIKAAYKASNASFMREHYRFNEIVAVSCGVATARYYHWPPPSSSSAHSRIVPGVWLGASGATKGIKTPTPKSRQPITGSATSGRT